jgi:serine O-acetyltransferase
MHAVWVHRVAHWLWRHKLRFFGRLLSHVGRLLTGVEIHPGAEIGRRFFIDHGMGVVIGETAEIGDDVLMYQGVVLGGTSLEKHKRHPTVEDGVVIGAGAVVLGPITVGKGARVGAGSVVVKPVPAGATVVGVPARTVAGERQGADVLEHGDLPDPVAEVVRSLAGEIEELRERLARMESLDPISTDRP